MPPEDFPFVPRVEFDELQERHQDLERRYSELSERLYAIEQLLGVKATENAVQNHAVDPVDPLDSGIMKLPDRLEAQLELSASQLEKETLLRTNIQTIFKGILDAAHEKISRNYQLPQIHTGWRADKKNDSIFGHPKTHKEDLGNNGQIRTRLKTSFYPHLAEGQAGFTVTSFEASRHKGTDVLSTHLSLDGHKLTSTVTTGPDKEVPEGLLGAVFNQDMSEHAYGIFNMAGKPKMPTHEELYYNPSWPRWNPQNTYKVSVNSAKLEVTFASSATAIDELRSQGCTASNTMSYTYDAEDCTFQPSTTLLPGCPEQLSIEEFMGVCSTLIATIPRAR